MIHDGGKFYEFKVINAEILIKNYDQSYED